jgi:hypothetical protein
MISLISGVVNGSENVLALQRRIVGEDFLKRSSRSEQFQDIGNADALATNARTAPAFALFYGDPTKTF